MPTDQRMTALASALPAVMSGKGGVLLGLRTRDFSPRDHGVVPQEAGAGPIAEHMLGNVVIHGSLLPVPAAPCRPRLLQAGVLSLSP